MPTSGLSWLARDALALTAHCDPLLSSRKARASVRLKFFYKVPVVSHGSTTRCFFFAAETSVQEPTRAGMAGWLRRPCSHRHSSDHAELLSRLVVCASVTFRREHWL